MSLTRRLFTGGIGLASLLYGCSNEPTPNTNENSNPPINQNVNENQNDDGLRPELQKYVDELLYDLNGSGKGYATEVSAEHPWISDKDLAYQIGGGCPIYLIIGKALDNREDIMQVCGEVCEFEENNAVWSKEFTSICQDTASLDYSVCKVNIPDCEEEYNRLFIEGF